MTAVYGFKYCTATSVRRLRLVVYVQFNCHSLYIYKLHNLFKQTMSLNYVNLFGRTNSSHPLSVHEHADCVLNGDGLMGWGVKGLMAWGFEGLRHSPHED